MKNLLITLLLSGLLVGCGRSDEAGKRSFQQDNVLYRENPRDGLWQKAAQPPIRFTLEQIYGAEDGEDELLLNRPGSVLTDAQGNIYLYDYGRSRLSSFSPDGTLRWQTGRKGEGPGEFSFVTGMVYDGRSTLLIANKFGSRIDFFDLQGNYLRSMGLKSDHFSPSLEGFIPPDTLVFSSPAMNGELNTKVEVYQIGDRIKKIAEWMTFTPDEVTKLINDYMSTGPAITLINGQIVASGVAHYVLNFYSTRGKLLRSISRDFDGVVRPGVVRDGSLITMMTFSRLGTPLDLKSGYFLVNVYWTEGVDDPDEYIRLSSEKPGTVEKTDMNSLDLYRDDGTLLYSLVRKGAREPEIGRPVHVDSAGRLYTIVKEPFQQIRRYRVEIVEK